MQDIIRDHRDALLIHIFTECESYNGLPILTAKHKKALGSPAELQGAKRVQA